MGTKQTTQRIVLQAIVKRFGLRLWPDFIWPRIGFSDEHLTHTVGTFRVFFSSREFLDGLPYFSLSQRWLHCVGNGRGCVNYDSECILCNFITSYMDSISIAMFYIFVNREEVNFKVT